jgi:hypothetical protein
LDRRPFTITQVRKDADGAWRARVTADGVSIDVDRRCGSWLATVRVAPGRRTFERRDVLPHVAAALQAKLPPEERGRC